MTELTITDLLDEKQPASKLRVLKTEELELLADRIRSSKERESANRITALLDEVSRILSRRYRELFDSPGNSVGEASAKDVGLPDIPKLPSLPPSIGDINLLMSNVDMLLSPYMETVIDLAHTLIGKTGGLSPEMGVHYVVKSRSQIPLMITRWEMPRAITANELHAVRQVLRLGYNKSISGYKSDGTGWNDYVPYRNFANEDEKDKQGIYFGPSNDYFASAPGAFVWHEFMPGAEVESMRHRHPDWRAHILSESPEHVRTRVQLTDGGIRFEELAQDDFLMVVVQLSYLLAHGKLIEQAPLWTAIYRDLNKIGTTVLDRESLWGTKQTLSVLERVVLLPYQKPDRAAKMRIGAESVLLVGVPGVGKTVLEHYLMGSSYNAIFAPIDSNMLRDDLAKSGEKGGSKILVQVDQVMKRTTLPVIPIIDDIDVILDEEGVVSKFLNMMQGIRQMGLRIIASTNYLEKIDQRLLEPGRFSKVVHVPLPGRADRYGVLMTYLKRLPFESMVEQEEIAKEMAEKTDGWSHRYLWELTVDVGRICVEQEQDVLLRSHFDEAFPELATRVQLAKLKEWDDKIRRMVTGRSGVFAVTPSAF